MTYCQKLDVALNKNIPYEKNLHEELIALNKLRNKVGHELEFEVSESDIDTLGYTQGKIIL